MGKRKKATLGVNCEVNAERKESDIKLGFRLFVHDKVLHRDRGIY